MNLVYLLLSHTLEHVHLLNLGLLHFAVAVGYGYVHALLYGATVNTAHSYTTCIA